MSRANNPSSAGVPLGTFSQEEPQEPLFTNENLERLREQKEEERRIRARIMQIRFFSLVFLVLLLSTLYVAGLNAYAVWNSWPKPYHLKAIHSMGGEAHSAYRVHLDWRRTPAKNETIIRPRIRMRDGNLIPLSEQDGILLPVGGSQKDIPLEINLPQNVTPGVYEGALVFQKDSGPENFPSEISIPVRLEVSKWKNWWPLATWFAIVSFVFLVFYLGSLLIFPKPKGFIRINLPESNTEIVIPLRKKWAANLFPWTRSSVELERVWSKLKGKLPVRPKGYLLFDVHGMPPTIVLNKSARYMVYEQYMTYTDYLATDKQYLTPCGKSTRMNEGRLFLAGTAVNNIEIIFEYQNRKGFAQI